MPDDVRVPYQPDVRLEAPRERPRGFTAANTSGLSSHELAALNRTLERLTSSGLSEPEAKLALDAAVRQWLACSDAGDADLQRLLAGRASNGRRDS